MNKPETNNYIYQYYQAICDGSEVVGRWIREWYEYLIKGLQNKSFFYDHKKAMRAIKFKENFCHHHEGELAPQLLKLELWQKAFYSVVYGIIDSEGNRQFREVLLIVGRKNGKTLMAASDAEYMTFLDGEYGARTYFVAPKLEQARLCYDAFYQMIRKEPELEALAKKRRTDIYIESTNASAQPLAFNAKKSDGLNPHFVVCDEIAAWQGDQGLKQYEVLKSALGARRQPMIMSITTANYIEGIYDELMKRGTAVISGNSKETRFAPFIYQIDNIEKWNDINELRKSMPNLNVSVSVDYMLEEIAIAEGSLSKKVEFLTKYCNIKQSSSVAWLPADVVERASGDPLRLEDFKSSYCVAGIDLSMTTDLCACTAVIEKNGELYVFGHFFLPSEKIEEATQRDGVPYQIYIQRGLLTPSGQNFVDYEDCFNWFRTLVEEYEILPLMVGYDRYSAQYLIKDMEAYGFRCDDVFQGENLYGTMLETQGWLEDGKIHIGDNDLLKSHLLNSAVKMSQERGRGRLIKLQPSLHIDGVASLLCAMTVRQKWFGELGDRLVN